MPVLTDPSQPRQDSILSSAMTAVRLDFAPKHQQPSAVRILLATVVSILGSLAADAILVAIGTRIFPSTHSYVHFRFADYAEIDNHWRDHRLCGLASRDSDLVGPTLGVLANGSCCDRSPLAPGRIHPFQGPALKGRSRADDHARGDRRRDL